MPDTSRATPPASSTAGRSAPGAPTRSSFIVRLLFFRGGLAADNPGQEQRKQDHAAVDGLDPVVRDVRQVQDVLHEAEQDHARGSADHVAAAALQAHAADHGRGEDGEDDALAVPLLAGHRGYPAGFHEPAERGQHAAGDVHADLDPLDLYAGGAGGGRIAADRVDRAPGLVIAQEQPDQDEYEGSDHE